LRHDAELAAVNVDRMRHAIVAFRNPPAKQLAERRGKVEFIQREWSAIDAVGGKLLPLVIGGWPSLGDGSGASRGISVRSI
jgi:hypothetical protein